MRKYWMSGGLLAAGALLVLGAGYMAGGSPQTARAQTPEATECPEDLEAEEVNCLVIEKITEPDDSDQDFAFDVAGANEGDFELNGGETAALTTDADGVIEVSEDAVDGWTLSIACSEPDGVEVTEDEDAGSVEVDFSGLDEGEFAEVTCEFTNEEVEATATPTATTTSTPTTTATTQATVQVNPTATRTPVPPAPTVVPGGTISPPATGTGGLK